MANQNLQAIVLAAGKSTRFNTKKTKLTEKICGRELILYPTKLLESLEIPTTVIVGYQKEVVQETVTKNHKSDITFVEQKQQLGTGHAVVASKALWKKDHLLIMNGDMPLIDEQTIQKLYEKHLETNASITFLIAHNPDPSVGAYGRIVEKDGSIKIVEAKEFEGDITEHCCINAGVYIVNKIFLQNSIDEIKKSEKTEEFYLTDLVDIASKKKCTISTMNAPLDHVRGINTFQELWAAEQIKHSELIRYWMSKGVHFSVAQNVHLSLDVEIGSGTQIGCGVHLLCGTKIGKNCSIQEFTIVKNSTIEDNVTVNSHCVIKDAHIGNNTTVGPYAHVHSQSKVNEESIIGNFVEVKNSTVGKKTKAKHLSYLGDSSVGDNVNIGAGTITCNHNGATKHKTTIKDGAYIGSNNTLVAPVTIEKNAFTAAGSTITKDVEQDALALGRARQVNKKGYAKKLHAKKTSVKTETSPTKKKENESDFSFVAAVKTNNESIKTDNT